MRTIRVAPRDSSRKVGKGLAVEAADRAAVMVRFKQFRVVHSRVGGMSAGRSASLGLAVMGRNRGTRSGHGIFMPDLAGLWVLPPDLMCKESEAFLIAAVDRNWATGWQPAELARQGRRGCQNAAGARLVLAAIAADNAQRSQDALDPRWRRQLAELDLPEAASGPGWLRRWATSEELGHRQVVETVSDAICNLGLLPPLEPLLPPPGSSAQWVGLAANGTDVDPILKRIRALLAKAESSTFEAEATAFTAKAQELMTKYAIDSVPIEGGGRSRDEMPVAVRVPIERPYADAKSLLLAVVAKAGRARSVFHRGLDLSTIIGFAADVAACEMLFTSLLLQAQHALARSADGASAGGRTRSKSYRSAFLFGYAHRIGDRLEEINQVAVREAVAERGEGLLPALRSRSARVDDHVDELFGELGTSRMRIGCDPAGWVGGAQAADAARLHAGDIAGPR